MSFGLVPTERGEREERGGGWEGGEIKKKRSRGGKRGWGGGEIKKERSREGKRG